MKFKILLTALFTFVLANFTTAATFTAIASGNWSSAATWGGTAPGTNIFSDDIVIPSGITVTMDQNVEFSGLLSTFEIMGTLNSTTTSTLTMTQGTITGSGEINIDAFVIGSFGGSSFTGDFTVKSYTNAGANLVFTTLIDVTETLFLEAGTITLDVGANLSLHQDATIMIDDGLLVGNGGLFTTDGTYTVNYTGSSKYTGMELEGSGTINVEVNLDNNNQDLTLSSNTTINGNIDHKSGTIELNGKTLTVSGDYMATNGTMIVADGNAKIIVKSNGSLSSGFTFDSNNNSIGDIEIEMTSPGKVVLNSDIEVVNSLMIKNGDIELDNSAELSLAVNAGVMIDNGAIIATNGTFMAASNYDVSYTGAPKNAGIELSGSGLRNVTINLGDDTYSLTLTTNAKVNGVLNFSVGTLNLNGNTLEIAGNYNSATEAKIKGSSTSNITVSSASKLTKKLSFTADGQMLNNLTVNIGNGDDLELGSDLTVNQLILVSGGVMLKDNSLTIDNTGSITGATTSRYVTIDGQGALKMMVNTAAYTAFPVGTSTSYSPANLKLNSGAAATYSVRVMNGVWAWGTSGTNLAAERSVVNCTWDITSSATTNIDVNMKLEWTSDIEVNSFDRTKAFISHYSNGNWDVTASAAATSTTNGTYEITRSNVTSLSPFAVADENSSLTVDNVEIFVSKMYPNPVTNTLTCGFSISEPTAIDVVDITGKVVYSENITGTDGFTEHIIDFSRMPSGVYFVKVSTKKSQIVQKVIK